MALSPLATLVPTIISTDGTKIWAAQAGRSARDDVPVIIFIPGFACSSLFFEKQFSDQTLLDNYRLITYEPRGQGRSDQPLDKGSYASARHAEDFRAVCQAFGARRYEEVANPLIFNVFGPMLSADPNEVAGGLAGFLESCFLEENTKGVSYTTWSAMIGGIAQQKPAARELMMAERVDQDSSILKKAAADKLPIMAVIGEHDIHMFPDRVEQCTVNLGERAEFKLISEAGHAVMWEKPEKVNELIKEFVDRVW
ncbi:Alpha/Beta hydrolase protein [Diplogelasinospora grovesii]|uniref:Alpha/Beta hydrolase protein n=1 Tax=Diplogelasinospora grovesii TaxID=303347 RepID=A0AAN6N208_9PEZI|nr:Alpha/Beta hydrolase protein [Diplogelasinospora grovesii]